MTRAAQGLIACMRLIRRVDVRERGTVALERAFAVREVLVGEAPRFVAVVGHDAQRRQRIAEDRSERDLQGVVVEPTAAECIAGRAARLDAEIGAESARRRT